MPRQTEYTARELARAAGFTIRTMPAGGAVERHHHGRILEIGPLATPAEIVAIAARYLVLPSTIRITDLPPFAAIA